MNGIPPELLSPNPELIALLEQEAESTKALDRREATEVAYRSDARHFWSWIQRVYGCQEFYPVPAKWIENYLTCYGSMRAIEGDLGALLKSRGIEPKLLKYETLRRRLAGLRYLHKEHGVDRSDCPTRSEGVQKLLKGMATKAELASSERRAPLGAKDIERFADVVFQTASHPHVGLRDRALFAIMYWSGGRRRSEVVRLKYEHLVAVDGCYRFQLRAAKVRNSRNQNNWYYIQGAAAIYLEDWLAASGIRAGYLFPPLTKAGTFRQDRAGNHMGCHAFYLRLQKAEERLGYPKGTFTPHSIRAGRITDRIAEGANDTAIMADAGITSRHTLSTYYRAQEEHQSQTAADDCVERANRRT